MRFIAIFFIASPSLMGTAVIAALASGHDTLQPILLAAGLGFLVSLPVTWFVGRQLGG
jgi:hypothetical protein